MPDTKQQNGFTLLELLIAISIFSIGLLAIAAMAVMVIDSNKMSRNLTVAVNLAQNRIDDLKVTPYASIQNQTETALDENGTPGAGIYNRGTAVTASGGGAGIYKTVTVTVSWFERTARSVVLQTIIAQ